jgi:hypothetical protein
MKKFKYNNVFLLPLLFCISLFSPMLKAQLFKSSKTPPKVAKPQPPTNPHLVAARKYFKEEFFSAALFHLMELVKEEPQKINQWAELIDKVLDKTGTLPLYVYEPTFLQQIKSSTISLHLAHLAYKAKRYDEALARLSGVESNQSFYAESLLLKGTSEDALKKGNPIASYNQCIQEADKFTGITKRTKFKRYFVLIQEQCIINKARILYREGKFKQAIDTYDLIEKTSYSWPYILLDKAWAYYKLEDYNRSLGIVMTYRSPLLESYFLPESEILQSLSYFRLCLYNDSALVIDQFYKVYSEKAKSLRSIIDQYANSDDYFFNLVTKDGADAALAGPYLKSLRNQLRKQLKMNIHLTSYQRAAEEYERFSKKYPNAPVKNFLNIAVGNLRKLINRHTKEYIYYFLNSIHYYSYEMFNIKLEIISRKKDLVYENKRLISNRARGTFDNVQAGEMEYFFSFNGEFWADELGDYSFGLKSNCSTIDIPEKPEKKE